MRRSQRNNLSARRVIAVWLVAWLLVGLGAHAETTILHLKNGDRVTGEIEEESAQAITLTSPALGRLQIPTQAVQRRETIASPPPTPPKEESPAASPKPAPAPAASPATNAPPAASPAPAPPPAAAPAPKPVEPKAKGPKLWNSDLKIGVSLRYNSKKNSEFTIIGKTVYAKKPFTHTLDYSYLYGKTDGIISGDRLAGSEKSEYAFSPKMYLFNLVGAGYDDVRRIDFQYEISPGLGMQLINSTNWNFVLKGEIGLTYQKQRLAAAPDKTIYSTRFAQLFTWRIWDKLTLDAKAEYLLNMEDPGDYRLRFDATLRYPLMKNLSIDFMVLDLYDASPPNGVTRNDLQIRTALGMKF